MNIQRMRRVAREYGAKVRFVSTPSNTVVYFFKKIGMKWKHIGTLRYAREKK